MRGVITFVFLFFEKPYVLRLAVIVGGLVKLLLRDIYRRATDDPKYESEDY